MPATVIRSAYFPPYSSDGKISPKTAAASITPAAKDKTISENLCDRFLKIKPISAPMTVAPPTPKAVKKTNSIILLYFTKKQKSTLIDKNDLYYVIFIVKKFRKKQKTLTKRLRLFWRSVCVAH